MAEEEGICENDVILADMRFTVVLVYENLDSEECFVKKRNLN